VTIREDAGPGTAGGQEVPAATGDRVDPAAAGSKAEQPRERSEDLKRVVAILIMVVTLLGAGAAYLRTVFADHASAADRADLFGPDALVAPGRRPGVRPA
jgi:hypothetical protein